MIFIADYFAIGLVIILAMFFFENITTVRVMPRSSKIFLAVLGMTAINAVTDLAAGSLLRKDGVPYWLNMLVNTLYFLFNIVTTSCIAVYLFTKILEHTHRQHCRRNAYTALSIVLTIYLAVIISNPWTSLLFYFDEQGNYCRGPLNALGYFVTLVQMILVLVCYFRNRDSAGKPLRRALINVFPVVPVCIIIQRLFPEIMMNSILLAFADTVLFMTFMSQRHGVHALTELNDRHRFFDEVDHLIKKHEPFQIFQINLKNFSAINRKFGHLIGDEYLYQFAFSLEKIMKNGMTFHMNGTVFAAVAQYTDPNAAQEQKKVLLDFLDKGISFDQIHIETEYIVSHYAASGSDVSAADVYEIMEYAASKGYAAKQKYVSCSNETREENERRRYLRDRLTQVDENHGFEVWCQPIKCMATGKFCSMEALIRMREPNGKLISPAEFIPLAEETGQINAITWFVLNQVCRMLKSNPELEDTSVSINVPMSQLIEKDFASRFISTVDAFGVEHRRICIEFTERTILESFQHMQSAMNVLTDAGFRFFLDDFGVGYSNFNCLISLPFNVIKFDSALIHRDIDGLQQFETIKALTSLFHGRNLTVVAEGIEKPEEVQMLTEIGVDRIQGYVFARPMPENELLRFYREM